MPSFVPPGHLIHKPDGYFSTLITAPAVALYSLDEVKAHCRIDGTDEDTYLSALIQAATDYLDAQHGILGRALITQRWQVTFGERPSSDKVILPVPTVQQVTSISYYDTDNVEQSFAADNYRLIINGEYSIVELVQGVSWPNVYDRSDALWIQYDTGYGDAASDVPAAIRHAGLLLIGNWFENREAVTQSAMSELPMAVKSLLQPFRLSRSLF